MLNLRNSFASEERDVHLPRRASASILLTTNRSFRDCEPYKQNIGNFISDLYSALNCRSFDVWHDILTAILRDRDGKREIERESGKQRIFDSFPFSFSIQLCCVKRVDRQSSISFSSFVRQFGSNSGERSLAFFGRSCFSFFDR